MRLLDRYSILDRIGSGGMATIYRATDDRLDRVVCVKLLRTTLTGGTAGESAVYQATYTHFLQEALALSKLSHSNTLRIYDFGYLDPEGRNAPGGGSPFHVSEYLDGGNLEGHVRTRGALSAEETLGILDGITGAVDEAHAHGIIHRDIKPSNIIFAQVRKDLVPKLADFGIAHSGLRMKDDGRGRSLGGESVSTVALFSPRWAAPEQLCGAPEGPRTDVYALGLVTTFMLSGQVLFGDEDVRLTFNDRVRSDDLVHERLAQVGMSGEIGKVVARSMVARPEDRIATAPEFYPALRQALKVRSPGSIAPLRAATPPPSVSVQEAPIPDPPLPPLSLEVEGVGAPRERVIEGGGARVRFVEVQEKLDLAFHDPMGVVVRMRVTLLPGGDRLNIKGLSCFVARPGDRPSPALAVSADREPNGTTHLVSAGRQLLGELTWSFGQPTPQGRLFVVDGRQLLVPYGDAQQAVVLRLSRGQDIVVMCRR